MAMRRVWFMHLYSCMRFSDLEILYSKLRKRGLELRYSNLWVDCFEVKECAEIKYKVVPIWSPIDNKSIAHWKLKARNDKYYIFEYDEKYKGTEFSGNVSRDNSCISESFFLLAFPMCVYYFVEKFNVLNQNILPNWMNYLFMISIFTIYFGHVFALITLLFQTRYYLNEKKRKQSFGGFLLRSTISCIVNILQIILVLIVLYGIL